MSSAQDDFLEVAYDAVEKSAAEVAEAQRRHGMYAAIYSRGIQMLDASGQRPTAAQVMHSFTEDERDEFLAMVGA